MAGGGHGGGHGGGDLFSKISGWAIQAMVAIAIVIGVMMGFVALVKGGINYVSTAFTPAHVEPITPSAPGEPVDVVMQVTVYNLTPEQTDSEPCIGAKGHNLCELNKQARAQGMYIGAVSCQLTKDGGRVDALPLGQSLILPAIGEIKLLDRTGRKICADDVITIDIVCHEGSKEKDDECKEKIQRLVRKLPRHIRGNQFYVKYAGVKEMWRKAGKARMQYASASQASKDERPLKMASFAGQNRITSGFGERTDPFTGKTRFHRAVDVAGKTGDHVQVMGEGTVVSAGKNGGLGNAVTVTFAHLSEINVKPGDTVKAGDVIGKVGSTGRSTGSHLHVEARESDGDIIDPTRFVTNTVTEHTHTVEETTHVEVPYDVSQGIGGP
jgi:hypothetical protein